MGLLQEYRILKRRNRDSYGRKKYLDAFPWYYGTATHVEVVDAKDLHSDKKYRTEIIDVGTGHSVGLMFALAPKKIITEIKCPLCGKVAKFNIHWQGFRCDDAVWEVLRQYE